MASSRDSILKDRARLWGVRQLLSACLCAAVMGGSAAALEIRDGSFSQEPSPLTWQAFGGGVWDSGVSYAGRGSARISDTQFSAQWVQTFTGPFEPGARYRLSARVRSDRPYATAELRIRWSLLETGELGSVNGYYGVSDKDGWKLISLDFQIPQEPLRYLQIVLLGGTEGNLWFDDVRVSDFEERLPTSGGSGDWLNVGPDAPRFTGLIVMAQHLPVVKSRNARILDTRGRIIYDGVEQWNRSGGDPNLQVVRYASSLEEAMENSALSWDPAAPVRIPLVVEAVGVAEGGPGSNQLVSLVIDEDEAERVRRALAEYDFFEKLAVVFVTQ